MSRRIPLTILTVSALCLTAAAAQAQDVIAKPDNNKPATSGSWFNIFSSDDKEKAAETPENVSPPTTGAASNGIGMTTPRQGEPALPPEVKKIQAEAMEKLERFKQTAPIHGPRLTQDILQRAEAAKPPKFPDAKQLGLSNIEKAAYEKKAAEITALYDTRREKMRNLTTVEYSMPKLDRASSFHDFAYRLTVTLNSTAAFSANDAKKIGAAFGITPDQVGRLCNLRIYARPSATKGHGDIGEEIINRKATVLYDPPLSEVYFDASARCSLPAAPPGLAVLIKEDDKYLQRLGTLSCAPGNANATPTRMSVEYLGDGKFSCSY